MPYPSWQPGMLITASRLTVQQWQYVRQGSNLSIASDVTVNDTSVQISVSADAEYLIDLYGVISGSQNGDARISWTVPAGTSVNRWAFGPAEASTGGPLAHTESTWRWTNSATEDIIYGLGGGAANMFREHMRLGIGSTSGTVQLKFAQGSSDVNASTLGANTTAYYLRIG